LKDGAVSDRTFLEEITIRSIGVIDQASLELSKGLTVLTGETGAGKTMILTALNLVLGGKSDSSLVRKGSERLVASGRFAIPKKSVELFEDGGATVEDGEIIITRTVNSDGKSKAATNGVSVPASVLSAIAENLVEVHGQSANIALTKSSKQRELLDQFGGADISKNFETYQESFRAYHELKDRISEIKKSLSQSEKEIAELEEFVEAFKKLSPKDNEIEELDQMIARLSSVEELRLAGEQALSTLSDEESGALTTLGMARKALEIARSKDVVLEGMYQNLSESFFLVSDASSSLSSYLSALEADPQALENMQLRKSGIVSLIKRWGGVGTNAAEIEELTIRFKNSATRISDLRGGDARVAELEKEFMKAKAKLKTDATALSAARDKCSGELSKAVTKEIIELSMPHTTLTVAVTHPDYSTAMKESDFTSSGCDEVAIYLQGDRSAPLVLLSKGASGGEMSRVMLALEVVLAKTHPVGTYVFDEIDAGVGGKAAIEVGRRLFELSKYAQVIVVTHLPQVAAWADSHFVVTKNNDGVVTQSDVKRVESSQRVDEIARMLAGLEESSSAKEHATELLAMRVR